jgi:hypothetical protein
MNNMLEDVRVGGRLGTYRNLILDGLRKTEKTRVTFDSTISSSSSSSSSLLPTQP